MVRVAPVVTWMAPKLVTGTCSELNVASPVISAPWLVNANGEVSEAPIWPLTSKVMMPAEALTNDAEEAVGKSVSEELKRTTPWLVRESELDENVFCTAHSRVASASTVKEPVKVVWLDVSVPDL